MMPLKDGQALSGKRGRCRLQQGPSQPNYCLISDPTECALEDETYADGAETEVDCNRCVCACGNWVCTAMTCDGELCPWQKKEAVGDMGKRTVTGNKEPRQ